MNPDHKKTVLRMIPYGIYVLTADDGKGNISAATVNWVTQTAFAPPLLVVGVKTDSGTYQTVKTAQTFALNMLGKDQKSLAFKFFRPAYVSDEALKLLASWRRAGKIRFKEDVLAGIEQMPEAFLRLLQGKSFGKQIVQIS